MSEGLEGYCADKMLLQSRDRYRNQPHGLSRCDKVAFGYEDVFTPFAHLVRWSRFLRFHIRLRRERPLGLPTRQFGLAGDPGDHERVRRQAAGQE